jgi:hypothetical protein
MAWMEEAAVAHELSPANFLRQELGPQAGLYLRSQLSGSVTRPMLPHSHPARALQLYCSLDVAHLPGEACPSIRHSRRRSIPCALYP